MLVSPAYVASQTNAVGLLPMRCPDSVPGERSVGHAPNRAMTGVVAKLIRGDPSTCAARPGSLARAQQSKGEGGGIGKD
jgi:hypothetical protein